MTSLSERELSRGALIALVVGSIDIAGVLKELAKMSMARRHLRLVL
jgi:hypothetical protein